MNERIKELAEQANLEIDPAYPDHNQKVLEKFAELIVRECCVVMFADPRLRDVRSATRGCARSIKQHFGVEETKGWVCPRCGVDRTKTVCPHGYAATIEGKCPMIAVAQ